MRSHSHTVLVPAVLAALIALVGGCGSTEAVTTGAGGSPAPSAPAATATATPASPAASATPSASPSADPAAVRQQRTAYALRDLDAARTRWEALGLTTYTYRLTRQCFCPEDVSGPFAIEVVDGEVVGAEHETLGGTSLDDKPTVDELFREVEGYLEDGAVVAASYDADTGLPKHLQVDVIPRVEHPDGTISETVDDELTYSAELVSPTATPAP